MLKIWLILLFVMATLCAVAQADLRSKALSYRGTRYHWGGTTSRGGFDCSGFVMVVFKQLGIHLPRNSRGMYTAGIKVAKSTLKTGDLLFFATRSKNRVNHVGIYLGNNEFIHSATSGGVKTSKLTESYYAKRFVSARRVTNLTVEKTKVTQLKKMIPKPKSGGGYKVE